MSFETNPASAGGLATAAKHPDREYTEPGRRAFLSRFAGDEERSAHFRELNRLSREKREDPATTQRLADIGRLLMSVFERLEDETSPE